MNFLYSLTVAFFLTVAIIPLIGRFASRLGLPMESGRYGLFHWSRRVARLLDEMASTVGLEAVNLHVPPLIPRLFVPRPLRTVVTMHTTYLGMSGRFCIFRPNVNTHSGST